MTGRKAKNLCSIKILTPRQAGRRGLYGWEPRLNWPHPTYWLGSPQHDAVKILHAESAHLGAIQPLAKCSWIDGGKTQSLLVAYRVHLRDGRLPILLDVRSLDDASRPHVQRAYEHIGANAAAFAASALIFWDADKIRDSIRLANAHLILSGGRAPTATELLAVLTALNAAGGSATAAEIGGGCGLGAIAWAAILRCLLAGKIRMVDRNAPLNGAALLTL